MDGPGWDVRVDSPAPGPLGPEGLRRRIALTGLALAQAGLGFAAIPLLVGTLLSVVLAPVFGVGLLLAHAVVPATQLHAQTHRRLAGAVLGERVEAAYAEASGLLAPAVWFRDPSRWRDVGSLAFSATGGLVLSLLVPGFVAQAVVDLVFLVVDTGLVWVGLTLLLTPAMTLAWWFATPALVRARALADRGILGARVEALERRVAEVTATRAESLDHSAAEVRRIERDLHDGAQARIVSLGMSLGLAEELVSRDPEAAAALLREARGSTVDALEDLRSVVRGIHPPVLSDRGLVGAVEALAAGIALPVRVDAELAGRPPAPVESALYFAIAEALTNAAKHAGPTGARVELSHRAGVLRVVVGDDGSGGADPDGSGLSGVRRRLAAFDGSLRVESPPGGPTSLVMEVPCALSSPRTTPSCATD